MEKKDSELLKEFKDSLNQNACGLHESEGGLHGTKVGVFPRMLENAKHLGSRRTGKRFNWMIPSFDLLGRQKVPISGTPISMQDFFVASTKSSDQHDKWHRHVMVVGPAGAGKSTVLAQFAQDVIAGQISLSDSEDNDYIVHVLNLRNFRQEEVPLTELLFGNMSHRPSGEAIKIGYRWLMKNIQRVLFVIDSLDTLGFKLTDQQAGDRKELRGLPPLEEKCCAADFLYNLFSGRLFEYSKIISSSRAYAVREIAGVNAERVVTLTGFTQDSMQKVVKGFLGEKEGERVWNHMCVACPGILPLCESPAFLIFTVIGYGNKNREGSFTLTTMTRIMISLLDSLISSQHALNLKFNEQGITILNKMKKLSYDGTMKGKVLFAEEDFEEAGLTVEECTDLAFPLPLQRQKSWGIMQGQRLKFFVHQVIEEVLCAMYVAELKPKEFRNFLKKKMFKGRGELSVVGSMLSGLLLDSTVQRMALRQQLLKGEGLKTNRSIFAKWLKNALSNATNSFLSAEICNMIYEAGDEKKNIMPRHVSSVLSIREFTSRGHLSSQDMYVLASVHQHCQRIEFFSMDNCSLEPESLEILCREFTTSSTIPQIYLLSLGQNIRMDVTGLSALGKIVKSCKVQELILSSCDLTSDQMEAFSKSVDNAKMKVLNISDNDTLDAKAMESVGQIVRTCQVETLHLTGCNMSPKKLEAFAASSFSANISKLCVGCNQNMEVAGLALIGDIVKRCQVQDLALSDCDLTSDQMKAFSLSVGDTEIKKLSMSANHIFDAETMVHLAEIVKKCKVDNLDLSQCNLSPCMLEAFKEASVGARVSLLVLNQNIYMEDEGMLSVGQIVHQCAVNKLELLKCSLTSDELRAFKRGLGDGLLHELNIEFAETTSDLIEAFTKLFVHVTGQIRLSRSFGRQESWTDEQCDKIQQALNLLDSTELRIVFNGMGFHSNPTDIRHSKIVTAQQRQKRKADEPEQQGVHVKRKKKADKDKDKPKAQSVPPVEQTLIRGHNESDTQMDNAGTETDAMSESMDESCEGPDGYVMKSQVSRKRMGPDGGRINIHNCSIQFPRKAFDNTADVSVKLEIDSSKWPKGYIGITPMLYVDTPQPLQKPVVVQMTSWCKNNGSKTSRRKRVSVLHLAEGRSEWEVITKLPFTDEITFQFECLEFSPVIIALEEESAGSEVFLVDGFLYADKENNFTFAFCLKDEMVLEDLEKRMAKRSAKPLIDFDTIDTKLDDKITAKLSGLPEKFRLHPQAEYTIQISNKYIRFTKKNSFNFTMENDAEETRTRRISMKCDVLKNDEVAQGDQWRNYTWIAQTSVAGNAGPAHQSVTYNLTDSRSTVAGTVIQGDARATVRNRDGQTTVAGLPSALRLPGVSNEQVPSTSRSISES